MPIQSEEARAQGRIKTALGPGAMTYLLPPPPPSQELYIYTYGERDFANAHHIHI